LSPGFKRALIAPQLGDLAWAEGKVPTPRGVIVVHVEKTETGLSAQVALPESVAAELRLPADGRDPIITGTRATMTQASREWVIVLPPGATATITST
jgi:alpha-L-rhamnosidase